jgi:hypothetical protein
MRPIWTEKTDLLACKNAAPFILVLRIIPVFVLLVSDFLSVL